MYSNIVAPLLNDFESVLFVSQVRTVQLRYLRKVEGLERKRQRLLCLRRASLLAASFLTEIVDPIRPKAV